MKMRKTMSVFALSILIIFLITVTFFGRRTQAESQAKDTTDKIQVVATIFPEYDWAREILGEDNGNYELTLLLNRHVDMHSFQPTAEDILKLSSCDLLIYVGGESDAWVEDVLATKLNPDMKTVNLMEILGDSVKEEVFMEGMAGEADAESEDEAEYDEHVWLSLRNTKILVQAICDAFTELDPETADSCRENTESYLERLDQLDEAYLETVEATERDTLLFADRFPFRYLVDDYGIRYYAAFAGCSAETEASFEMVAFLAEKVNELDLKAILTIDGSDGKLAGTVAENTKTKDQKILVLDSLQSVTTDDGVTYLSVMERNLEVLREALN